MEENGKLVKFLYADREAVAEEKEDGNIIRFIRGYDLVASDSESARTYYHYASDEQGSITHVLGDDENGEYSLKNYYEYGAFGDFREQYEKAENRFGYNGEIFDPIGGQYYLRARYYNPVIGRFTQEDTYYGAGLNLYAYCRNLPVGYEDPSGHYPCKEKQDLYKKYREQGMTAQEANRRANYDLIKKNQGQKAADRYLNGGKTQSNPKRKPFEIKFKRNKNHDDAEFSRQLKNQEKGMNKLSLYDYINNRKKYKGDGRSKDSAKYQKQARVDAYNDKVKELRKKGMSLKDAEKKAKSWLKTQAALHDPGQIAGGFAENVTGMGDKRINSSIGSQWKNKISDLDAYVDKISKGMTSEELKNTLLSVILTYE